jgi:hypothetical protein
VTKLPYRYRVEGKGEKLWNVYYGHPPERLTTPMVRSALRHYRIDNTDEHLRGLSSQVPGHSYAAFLTKLAAINTLASANGKDIPSVVASALSWIRDESRFVDFDSFLQTATPADAESMMRAVGKKTTGCRSLLSKYLAYHSANRWMIYDSFVRCYLWATYSGIRETGYRGIDGRRAVETLPLRRFSDLQNYHLYFDAVEWTWDILRLPADVSAREKEYVLWHRAKNCRIGDWKAPKKRKRKSLD